MYARNPKPMASAPSSHRPTERNSCSALETYGWTSRSAPTSDVGTSSDTGAAAGMGAASCAGTALRSASGRRLIRRRNCNWVHARLLEHQVQSQYDEKDRHGRAEQPRKIDERTRVGRVVQHRAP